MLVYRKLQEKLDLAQKQGSTDVRLESEGINGLRMGWETAQLMKQ